MFKKLRNIRSPEYIAEHPELQVKHFIVYGITEIFHWFVIISVTMFVYYLVMAFFPDLVNWFYL